MGTVFSRAADPGHCCECGVEPCSEPAIAYLWHSVMRVNVPGLYACAAHEQEARSDALAVGDRFLRTASVARRVES